MVFICPFSGKWNNTAANIMTFKYKAVQLYATGVIKTYNTHGSVHQILFSLTQMQSAQQTVQISDIRWSMTTVGPDHGHGPGPG